MMEEFNDYAEVGTCPACGGHMKWSCQWQCWVSVCCEEADLDDVDGGEV